MCGIAGYVGERPLDPERVAARARADAPPRPGPPGAHRLRHPRRPPCRAAPRAAQHHRPRPALEPAVRASAERWIAYNGELYNYVEVRDGAGARAARASRTESDTEVLLQALDRRRLGRARPLRGHVGVRGLRRGDRRAGAVPRPLRREAALPLPRRRRPLLRLRGQVHRRAARPAAARSTTTTCTATWSTATRRSTRRTRPSSRARGAARRARSLHVGADGGEQARAPTGRRGPRRRRRHELRGGRGRAPASG